MADEWRYAQGTPPWGSDSGTSPAEPAADAWTEETGDGWATSGQSPLHSESWAPAPEPWSPTPEPWTQTPESWTQTREPWAPSTDSWSPAPEPWTPQAGAHAADQADRGGRTGENATVDGGAWALHSDADWGQYRPDDPPPVSPLPAPQTSWQVGPAQADGPGSESMLRGAAGFTRRGAAPAGPAVPGTRGHDGPGAASMGSGAMGSGAMGSGAMGSGGTGSYRLVESRGPVDRGGRVATEPWSRTDVGARHRNPDQDETAAARRSDDEPEESPGIGRVLAFTGTWYAIPTVLYVIWFVAVAGDRRGIVGHEFIASLPWVFVAVVLSLAVGVGLRRTTAGWRALGLSFAAAVIGAGIATLVHSLAS